MKVVAIVPVLNEEVSIGAVVTGLLSYGVDEVIVVDNGSDDRSVRTAEAAGAIVIHEPRRGYGSACLAGVHAATGADIVVFADGDGCDDPEDLPALVEPIRNRRADMVIGSRLSGTLDAGALPLHSRFGNRLAAVLLRALYGQCASDLGPFRAIEFQSLARLGMKDTGYGWTAEMQAKAARLGLRVAEIPVHYRRRGVGRSKITGDLRASAAAGCIILKTLFAIRLQRTVGRQ